MAHLVAAPDKFRGTATAREAAAAVLRAATDLGWSATAAPMSDGGEGFVEVLGGDVRTTVVHGPLGEPTTARWSMLDDGTAVVESAAAAGRALLATPLGDQPVDASTAGVGELLAAAQDAGAARVVVGVGGTASTDGGRGCVAALEALGVTIGVPLVAACDVLVRFADAPRRFGPQKGATPAQVAELGGRLGATAAWYLERFGVDVTGVDGAGAGGGLAGGLVALGATVVAGAAYVARSIGLAQALDAADLVVTGEGALDDGTLDGKVVGTVLGVRATLPALILAGTVDDTTALALRAGRQGRLAVVALDDATAAGTPRAIERAVRAHLATTGR